MAGVSNRRTAEQDSCPQGFTRVGGQCQRSTAQATPFAAEPKTLSGAWRTLPAEFQAPEFQAQAYAPTISGVPITAFQSSATPTKPYGSWIQLYGDYERRAGRARGPGEEFGVLTLDARSSSLS